MSIVYADFIDLENKVVVWHSDSGIDNVLQLGYEEEKISISITKSPSVSSNSSNSIRIRISGSDYGTYYQEFEYFLKELCLLECQCNSEKLEMPTQKKKSFLNRFGQNKRGN